MQTTREGRLKLVEQVQEEMDRALGELRERIAMLESEVRKLSLGNSAPKKVKANGKEEETATSH